MGVTLDRLDPSAINVGSVIVITARRNSGKTVLLRDVMFHLRKSIDVTVAMTQSVSSAEMLREHVPASCVYDQGLDLGVIQGLLVAQRASLAAGKRARNVLLVLDDVSNDKALRAKGNVLGDCWRNGRHAHVTVICTTQCALDLGPDLRQNTDFCFALKEPILANRKKLHEAYFGQSEFSVFAACFARATEAWGAMVLNNTLPESDIERVWSWYRAAPIPPKPIRCAADVYFKLRLEQCEASKVKATSRVHVEVPRGSSAQPRQTKHLSVQPLSLQPARVLIDAVG